MQKQNNAKGIFVFEKSEKIHLVFHPQKTSPLLKHALSSDTLNFRVLSKNATLLSGKRILNKWSNADHFRVAQCGDTYFLTYIKNRLIFGSALHFAFSKNGLDWKHIGSTPSHQPSVLLKIPKRKQEPYVLFSASGKKYITCALSEDTTTWRELGIIIDARARMFDSSSVAPLTAYIYRGVILLFYTAKNGYGRTTLGAAMFHPDYPDVAVWRTDAPLWEEPPLWKEQPLRVIGGVDHKKYFFLYVERNGELEAVPVVKYWEKPYRKILPPKPKKQVKKIKKTLPKKSITRKQTLPKSVRNDTPLTLERFAKNPILEPKPENEWESFAAFNPAAFIENGIVHLLYRAQGNNGLSVIGYAQSNDGYTINHREDYPAYIPRETFEGGFGIPDAKDVVQSYMSAGGYGGCEDPKVTLIENHVYLTYVAFNGWEPPRIAISWIPLSAFSKKQWKKWSKPVLISPPGVVDKSAALFPEKINGKYVIFHRIFPDILIDFVDSLDDFEGKTYLRGQYRISPREGFWDRGKLSVGAPPIKTKEGWLVIYHAVSARIEEGGDLRYKIGAMLLDLNDPTKVIVRSREPILEPETDYENNGHKFGIAYPCGAVIKKDTLFVYYGASDKTVAVATAPIKLFLKALLAQKPFTLKQVTLK
jgi:predicted GH43/DUF377 family glycosyl hydrolase